MGKKNSKIEFVRNQLHTRLMQTGMSDDRASCTIDCISDEEIQKECPACAPDKKVKALGDGSLLKWLSDHKEDIKSGIDKIFSLLSLLGVLSTSKPPKG